MIKLGVRAVYEKIVCEKFFLYDKINNKMQEKYV